MAKRNQLQNLLNTENKRVEKHINQSRELRNLLIGALEKIGK
jgi:hypothetical protein